MTWLRDTQLLIQEEIMLCFLTEENKNFILIMFPPFSSLFVCLIHIHAQCPTLAIRDVLAHSVAISSQTSDILHLLPA